MKRRALVETATQERTSSRPFEQSTMPDNDAAAFSLGVAQRLMSSLTEFSIAATKENARLASELQIAALEALHESQSAALRSQPMWSDALTDPLRLFQGAIGGRRRWNPVACSNAWASWSTPHSS